VSERGYPENYADTRVAPYRASFQIVMGHGAERWQFPDPGHDIVERAQRHVRYGRSIGGGGNKALVLADVASALAYLIYDCPSTTLACEKLAQMRAAVRKFGV
jgi:hypothetical protein